MSPCNHPLPTADAIIETPDGFVLVRRKNPPHGWALPGGFVDQGEECGRAARREAREETGLDVALTEQFHTYSDPARDPRFHTLTVVYLARAEGKPTGGDDAADARAFREEDIPWAELAFDHGQILRDFFEYRKTGRRPAP